MTTTTHRKAKKTAKTPRSPKRPPTWLEPAELDALLTPLNRRCATGARNRAMLLLIYSTGLRVHEALNLSVGDVDTAKGRVTVRGGKGRKLADPDAAPIAEQVILALRRDATIDALDRWLKHREELGLTGRHPLFCGVRKSVNLPVPNTVREGDYLDTPANRKLRRVGKAYRVAREREIVNVRGKQLGTRYVEQLVKELARRAGVAKLERSGASVHVLRHSCASEMLAQGYSVPEVSRQLRHSSIQVTSIYSHASTNALEARREQIEGKAADPLAAILKNFTAEQRQMLMSAMALVSAGRAA